MLRVLSLRIAARKLPLAPLHVPSMLLFAFGAVQVALAKDIGGFASSELMTQLPWFITAMIVILHLTYAFRAAKRFGGLLGIDFFPTLPYEAKKTA
jgi:hypothetical protein